MALRAPRRLLSPTLGRRALSVAIAAHLLTVLYAAVPIDWPFCPTLRPLSMRWLDRAGLWQNWAMFSPEPISRNIDVRAEVALADGGMEHWALSQVHATERFGSLPRDRYVSYLLAAHEPSRADTWGSLARFVARQIAQRAPGRAPVHVTLIREWSQIPALRPELAWQPPAPRRYPSDHREAFFEYPVAPEDLRQH